jgi:hypothetical protein
MKSKIFTKKIMIRSLLVVAGVMGPMLISNPAFAASTG